MILFLPYVESLVLGGKVKDRGEEATHTGSTPFLLSWGKNKFRYNRKRQGSHAYFQRLIPHLSRRWILGVIVQAGRT